MPFSIVQFSGPQPITIDDGSGNSPLATLAATCPTVALLMGAKDGANINALTMSSGRLIVDGSGVTQPVSGTFWQATQPVSIAATVAVSGPLTDTQLRATPVPVSGTFFQATQPVSGTVAATQSGTWNVGLSTGSNTIGKVDQGAGGASAWKVDGSAITQPVSGTFWQATQPVSGTFFQATQPVSIAATVAVSGPLTDTQLRATAVPVSGTFFQATQPVSGTVTANIGTTNGLALDATLTGGTQRTKITDGTNNAAVKAASTASAAADPSLVVGLSPNSPLPAGTNTIGKVDQGVGGTAANAWFMKNTDGTNIAAVKAASTAAVATDPALVVAISPNGGLPNLNGETTGSGTITTIGSFGVIGYGLLSTTAAGAGTAAAFSTAGYSTLYFTITGTWVGTLYFEATQDGTNWTSIDAQCPGITNTVSFGAGTATPGLFRLNVAGLSQFRVRAPQTVVTSITGTITVSYRASSASSTTAEPQAVMGTSANGGAIKNNPFVMAGTANGKVAIASVDTNGVQVVQSYGEAISHGLIAGMSNVIRGRVSTNALTEVAIRGSLYTEQTSGATRSIKSSSASDTNTAGTGIRSVRIVYYTLTAGVIAGPFTEDKNLNGTTAVDTTANNICYIATIYALTVGSGGVAAGNIDLFTTTGGGGSAFARIALGDRGTRYAHHYVSTGVICNIKNAHASSTASSSNTPLITCRWNDPTVSTSAQQDLVDGFEVQGSQSATQLNFDPPPAVTGPAVIVWYVAPANTAVQVQKLEAGFYEQ